MRKFNCVVVLVLFIINLSGFYTYHGQNYILEVKKDMCESVQSINTIDRLLRNVNMIEKDLLIYVDRIRVVDYKSPYTEYWSEIYGRDIHINASAGWVDGLRTITLYPRVVNQYIVIDTILHEIGHLIDNDLKASDTVMYRYIYRNLSRLSNTNIREDFAEAIRYYYMGYNLCNTRKRYIENLMQIRPYDRTERFIVDAQENILNFQESWIYIHNNPHLFTNPTYKKNEYSRRATWIRDIIYNAFNLRI